MRGPVDLAAAVRDTAMDLDLTDGAWYQLVKTESLSFSSCHDCIIGQVRGHFFKVRLVDLGFRRLPFCPQLNAERQLRWAYRRGLGSNPDALGQTKIKQSNYIRTCWLREIQQRRDCNCLNGSKVVVAGGATTFA